MGLRGESVKRLMEDYGIAILYAAAGIGLLGVLCYALGRVIAG